MRVTASKGGPKQITFKTRDVAQNSVLSQWWNT